MADFDVKTGYSTAFRMFVDFAEKTSKDGYDSANAKATLAGRMLTVSPLSLHETSYILRKTAEKDSNNATRDLFRQAIIDMFGGEAKIPESVKDAMLLDDFGHGYPLTARRIMAVKKEVDSVLKNHAAFNKRIASHISEGKIGNLPQDMQDGLAEVVDHLRGIFGSEAVPPGSKITRILHPSIISADIADLRDAANVQGRDLTKDQIVAVFAGKAFDMLACKAAGKCVLAQAKARNPDVDFTEHGIGRQFCNAYPLAYDEIRNCKSPAEIEAALLRRGAEIYSFVDLTARCFAVSKTVVPAAKELLARELGLDSRIVATTIPLNVLKGKAEDLNAMIAQGTAPGCREKGYDMKAAYDALVNKFVRSRVDAYRAIEALEDLPEAVKNSWKSIYLAFRSVPAITPAQLLEVARQLDTVRLLGALSPNLPAGVAATLMDSIANELAEKIKTVTGNANFFDDFGRDELLSLYDMLIAFAEVGNPGLSAAIRNAHDNLSGPVNGYCQENKLNGGVSLVQVLVGKGGADMAVRVVPEHKYLAFVREDVEAVLDECGIIDENVRNTVKERMLERGRTDLAEATGPKTLSDRLAGVKAAARQIVREFVPEAPPAPGPVPERVLPPRNAPGPVPVIGTMVAQGAKMPKIANAQQLKDFIKNLTLDARFGSEHEDAKESDAIGRERQTYTFRGIVFRSERRKMHELYDVNTMKPGFTSRNDLAVSRNRTEAMGLGVKGKNEKGEETLTGPGATGQSGVSCAKTIGGVIGYVGGGHTFYIIDTTKIPKDEKAWDMENTILRNGLLKTDESNGEVNISYIPKKAIVGSVYIPAQSKIDDKTGSEERWATVRSIALGTRYVNLEVAFNPEYQP